MHHARRKCGTTAGGISLAKNLLKVAVQEFVNSLRHGPSTQHLLSAVIDSRTARNQAVFCSARQSSSIICSRMMNFCTLPVTVIGKASTNLM